MLSLIGDKWEFFPKKFGLLLVSPCYTATDRNCVSVCVWRRLIRTLVLFNDAAL